MRGRKPDPSKLQLIKGNPNKRKPNQNEPKPDPIQGAAPPEFLDDVAKSEWARIMKEIVPLEYLSSLDLGVLAAYCLAFSTMVRASKKVKATGDMIVVKGKPVTNPFLRIARDAGRDMIKAAAELGISPSSRSRVHKLEKIDDPNSLGKKYFG